MIGKDINLLSVTSEWHQGSKIRSKLHDKWNEMSTRAFLEDTVLFLTKNLKGKHCLSWTYTSEYITVYKVSHAMNYLLCDQIDHLFRDFPTC